MSDQSAETQISANTQAVLDEVLRLCRGVGYRVPGQHETWDEWDGYHKGRFAFANEIKQVLDQTDLPRGATHERINRALNRAADEVLDVTRDDGDELLRDAINLVVNAGLHYMEFPDASLEAAIDANYGSSVDEVLADLS